MNSYEAKQEARRERLLARADRLQKEGAARVARARDMASVIPFGQPILVGHYSERSDRAYRGRIRNNFDKGYQAMKAAEAVAARAESVGTGGISSDDPDAVAKLREELAGKEQLQATMAAANKVIRAFWKAGNRADNTDEELERYFEKLAVAGIRSKMKARELLKPDFCGRIGFADYQLSNNNANIRRIKGRIAQLERNATRETKVEELESGVRVVENAEENRLQLFFPGKPEAKVRDALKRFGFRWAPSEGAWQRQLNNAARYAAQSVLAIE